MKNRFVKDKKVKILIISSIILFIIGIIGLLYYIFVVNKEIIHEVNFILNEPIEQVLEVNSEYEELGCKLIVDGIENTTDLKINNSDIDTKVLGTYKVKYYVILDEKEYNYYRNITVVDTTKPEIKLNGDDKITILLNEKYTDKGATAKDNYDGDITDKIESENNIDNTKVGEYKVKYKVSDTSGNTVEIERTVIVKKPNIVVKENNSENKEVKKEVNPLNYNNTVTKNNFTSNGIYIEGYKKDNDNAFTIKLNDSYTYNMTSLGSSKYKGTIDLSNVENGTYNVSILSKTEEKLNNKLDFIEKISRSKVGNKLVTVNYNNDEVSIKVEDFYYQYDVVIDPGHGGDDPGATNEYVKEKDMNLKVSQYEKCRFENHGYKVYMTRNSDTYGNGMGPLNLKRLTRRAYEIGYYGSVSKVVYSNHHNAIGNNYYSGYELLIPGYLTSAQLSSELAIVNKFNSIYPLKENHYRFYATDYYGEQKYSKLGGNTYTFKDNYAVNRVPHELFNTKAIIYEGCYLTNKEDYKWYWEESNWKKVSEAKIEAYVNSMGGSYNSNNSSC